MKYDPVTTGLRASETVEIMQVLEASRGNMRMAAARWNSRKTLLSTPSPSEWLDATFRINELNDAAMAMDQAVGKIMGMLGMAAIGSNASVAIVKVVHTGGAKGNLFFGIHRTKAEADEALKESHMEGFVAPLHSPSVIPE